jgi:Cu/Ag efflux pump CusA
MMRWIVESSLRARGLVLAAAVAVMVFGVIQFNDMPRDVVPEFRPPTVEVQTEALGLSAEEVEQLITVPLEQDLLNGVAFLDFIRSESVPGLSRIEMIFEPGTELARARQVVNERLTQAHALPNVSAPPQMLQPLSSTSRVMMIGLSSQERSLIDMSVLAQWTIRPALMGIPGVSNVSIWGMREQQLQVLVDPARLQSQGVTLDEVVRTAGNALWVSPLTFLEASTPGTGGFYDTQTQRLGVQHIQPIKTPEDLANVTLDQAPAPTAGGEEGTPAPPGPQRRLGDVTTVVEDHQPLIGDAVFTDGPGLLLVVEKFPEANALQVTHELEEALDTLGPGMSGIEVNPSLFLPARYIESSTENLRLALVVGLVLLVLALAALLWNLRGVFISLVAIGLSLAAAIIVLSLRGETLNAMVVAGLVLALLVLIDDAIVSTDGILRNLGRAEEGGPSTPRAIATAVLQVRGPLLYATIILLLVLLPMFVLEGEMGAFVPPLVLSYAVAVVASLLVASIVTPALSMVLLSKGPPRDPESPIVGALRPDYDRTFSQFTRKPRPAYVAVGALLVVGLAVVPFLDRETSLVPSFKDRDMLISWEGAPGTSLPEMRRIAARAGAELKGLPGVTNVGGHVGRAVGGDQIGGANVSELWVSIDGSADYNKTVASIEEVVNGYPGIRHSVLTYPNERIDAVLAEPDGVEGKDLTVRLFGPNIDVLRTEANELSVSLAEVDGVEAPVAELPVMEPTLEVEVNLDQAQALGVKPGDVRRAAATVFSGIEVGQLFEDQKIFQVVVWGTPEMRNSVDNVRQLLIDKPDGSGQVRLDDVADVRVTPNPNVIRHDDVSRHVDIGVDVRGRDVSDVAEDIEARMSGLEFPLEYHAQVLPDYAEERSARLSFIGLSVAALLGVFLLLQAAFSSWRMATAAFVALPGALTGGLVAILVGGGLVTVGSLVGLLAVFGLAARHCVLFVRRCQEREDNGQAFGARVVRGAARDRFAPTVTTAVAGAVALLPLLIFGSRAGLEIVQPMAAVMLGGLVTSTLLSLFVVPALYLRFGSRPEGAALDLDLDLPMAAPDGNGDGQLRRAPSVVDA